MFNREWGIAASRLLDSVVDRVRLESVFKLWYSLPMILRLQAEGRQCCICRYRINAIYMEMSRLVRKRKIRVVIGQQEGMTGEFRYLSEKLGVSLQRGLRFFAEKVREVHVQPQVPLLPRLCNENKRVVQAEYISMILQTDDFAFL